MSEKSIPDLPPKKVKVARRRFLSSAILGGVTIPLACKKALGRNGNDRVAQLEGTGLPEKLPSDEASCRTGLGAIDSLNFSVQFIDAIYGRVVCVFQEDVIDKTASLAEEYENLMRLSATLEDQAPELKESAGITKIKETARAGIQSVANINNLAHTKEALATGLIEVAAAAVNSNELLIGASTLSNQQRSLTLSPAAVETLRKLLSEIRRIQKLVVGANTASGSLRNDSSDLYAKLGEIRQIIFKALSRLADRDKVETLKQIDQARTMLAAIDADYSKRLNLLSAKAKARCNKDNPQGPPAGFLSDYLYGTRELVVEELAALPLREGSAAGSFRFVKASMMAGPGWGDIVPLMGPVLHNYLVEDTDTRRRAGATAVRPFVRYGNQDANGNPSVTNPVRIAKFAEALKEIRPPGAYDRDQSRLWGAATKLHQLLNEKGW